jgi:hypothetical protein
MLYPKRVAIIVQKADAQIAGNLGDFYALYVDVRRLKRPLSPSAVWILIDLKLASHPIGTVSRGIPGELFPSEQI